MGLGFSANAVANLLKTDDWIDRYRSHMVNAEKELQSFAPSDGHFKRVLFHEIEECTADIDVNIRSTVQRWMLLFHYKSLSAFRVLKLLEQDTALYSSVQKKYLGVDPGPRTKEEADKLSPEEKQQVHEATIAGSFCYYNYISELGLLLSELFFSVESAFRCVCIGSCLEYSIKAVQGRTTIQHDEVFKTLRVLSSGTRDNLKCITCKIRRTCTPNPDFQKLSDLYELLYHLRVVKDYRLELYWEAPFKLLLENELVPRVRSILTKCDEIVDSIFSDYLGGPISLSQELEEIGNLVFNTPVT